VAITGSTDLGDGRLFLTVDHDPEVTNTDAPIGSLLLALNGIIYRKLDSGPSTNVLALTAASQSFDWDAGAESVSEIVADGVLSFEMPDSNTTKVIGADHVPVTIDLSQDVHLDGNIVVLTLGTGDGDVVLRLTARYIGQGETADKTADEVLTNIITVTNTDKAVFSTSYQLDNTMIDKSDLISLELERLGSDVNDTYDGSIGAVERFQLRFIR